VHTFKLTIAYDGTGFVGWQRQASGESIQGLLENALSDFDGRSVTVTGAGRTDAGVHARGQVASVSLERSIDSATLVRATNARLPAAIRVIEASEAPVDFHARFHARSKRYRYRIWNGEVISPFERAYAWHVAGPSVDVGAMAEAASAFEGRHDFAAFQAAGGETHSTVRTVFETRIHGEPGPHDTGREGALITYDISGDGFLRHMVRNIVGTLVEVGRGRRAPAWVRDVLESRDRGRAGPTAPAEGLFLMAVEYG
jgi:tRNA pseudouridine38-40 synthase